MRRPVGQSDCPAQKKLHQLAIAPGWHPDDDFHNYGPHPGSCSVGFHSKTNQTGGLGFGFEAAFVHRSQPTHKIFGSYVFLGAKKRVFKSEVASASLSHKPGKMAPSHQEHDAWGKSGTLLDLVFQPSKTGCSLG